MISLAFMGVGTQELIIIALIVLVLFGATKLPKLASSIGESVKNFKRGMREAEAEEKSAKALFDDSTKSENSLENKNHEKDPFA